MPSQPPPLRRGTGVSGRLNLTLPITNAAAPDAAGGSVQRGSSAAMPRRAFDQRLRRGG